jgi:hypothetical protein
MADLLSLGPFYETLRQILAAAYLSFYIQLLTIPIILGLTRHHAELSEFVLLIMLAEALLLIISTAVPASSTFVYFGITAPNTSETVSHFHLLRNGSLQIINPVQGLVSLPPFIRWWPLSAPMRSDDCRQSFPSPSCSTSS